MDGRRHFLKKVLGFTTILGVWTHPLLNRVGLAYAKAQNLVAKAKPEASEKKVTPLDQFDTMGVVKYDVDIQDWRLKVSGNVKNPLELTYDQLLELPPYEKKVELNCPGFFINVGLWKGVSMKPLLEMAQAAENATKVTVLGHNDDLTKTEEFPMEDILSNKVFFAHTVNGVALPEKHGYPLRIVAEGYLGDDWVKYVYAMKVI